MTHQAVLAMTRQRGFTVAARDGKLWVKPKPQPDLADHLRRHKAEIIKLLEVPATSATPATIDQLQHYDAAADVTAYFANTSRGPCIRCGQPVTRLGITHGFRNGFGDLVHLRCPS